MCSGSAVLKSDNPPQIYSHTTLHKFCSHKTYINSTVTQPYSSSAVIQPYTNSVTQPYTVCHPQNTPPEF